MKRTTTRTTNNNRKHNKFTKNALIFLSATILIGGIIAPQSNALNECAGQLTAATITLNNGTDTFTTPSQFQMYIKDQKNGDPIVGVADNSSIIGFAELSIKLPDQIVPGDQYHVNFPAYDNAMYPNFSASDFDVFINGKTAGKFESKRNNSEIGTITWNDYAATQRNASVQLKIPVRYNVNPTSVKLGSEKQIYITGCEPDSIKSNTVVLKAPNSVDIAYHMRASAVNGTDIMTPDVFENFDKKITAKAGANIVLDNSILEKDGLRWLDNISRDVANVGLYLINLDESGMPATAQKLKYTANAAPKAGEFTIENVSPQNVRVKFPLTADNQAVRWQYIRFTDNGQDGYIDRMPQPFNANIKFYVDGQLIFGQTSRPTWSPPSSSGIGEIKKLTTLTSPTLNQSTKCDTPPTINIPAQPHVEYVREDNPDNKIVKITAKAIDGYIFAPTITTTSWEFDLTPESCPPINPPEQPDYPEENPDQPENSSETPQPSPQSDNNPNKSAKKFKLIAPNTAKI